MSAYLTSPHVETIAYPAALLFIIDQFLRADGQVSAKHKARHNTALHSGTIIV